MPGWATASELAGRLRSRELGCVELTRETLNRIEEDPGGLGAFLSSDRGEALRAAEEAQRMLDAGTAGPLTGVPLAVKDNICVAEGVTTAGSRLLENFVSPYDATVIEKCREAGMVIVGKTNLDEFGMGSSNENSAFGPVRNPWNPALTAGGSSGGSAAAVAAGIVPLSLGSDTGGSIRFPAALCGIVGFKPTYGRVSRRGLVAFASSLDQIGPFARSVEDAALLAHTISGDDPREARMRTEAPISLGGLRDRPLSGLRLAWPQQLAGPEVQPSIRATFEVAISRLIEAGCTCEEVDLPMIRHGVSTYYIIAPSEASSNLARYDGIRFGRQVEGTDHVATVAKTRGALLGHEVKLRIIAGTYALSAGYHDAYFAKAQRVRQRMTLEMDEVLAQYDLIVSPTSPVVAFPIGSAEMDHLTLKQLDLCTIPANLGGYPSLSLPCGLAEGLPVGLGLTAQRGMDESLLAAAWSMEQELGSVMPPSDAGGVR
ncbi:MAG: Asp-tRNA(Asn)/Glu-tRNA(Gln) amidotransferase subunit GatA [Fimbriimonadaceae bacterium]|nr:Asp-tRNA(Asn)/Glu-tRNA(Gln) amidotransferase subunit GatA [Fimbriimonadaceae bacterium]